jgi:hypothetical protein
MRRADNWETKEDEAFALEIVDEIHRTNQDALAMRLELRRIPEADANVRLQ